MRWVLFSVAAVLIFTVFVTAHAVATPSVRMRNLPKPVWLLLCIFVAPIGGILYLMLGRPIDGPTGETNRTRKPVAPDDDPEFLRNLEKRLRDEGESGQQ